jgi:hypothetical protein
MPVDATSSTLLLPAGTNRFMFSYIRSAAPNTRAPRLRPLSVRFFARRLLQSQRDGGNVELPAVVVRAPGAVLSVRRRRGGRHIYECPRTPSTRRLHARGARG